MQLPVVSCIRHLFPAIISMIVLTGALIAQNDTILNLREVEVTAERIDLTDIGKHTDKLDVLSLPHHEDNLASLLSMQTPLYVRSYGAGTLATLGIRGGSASHTQLLWNGIPLRNPMVGLQDLALFPASFFDEAAIHYGGHGAAFGSGAVGGLISISNSTVSDSNQISLNLSAGSWGQRTGNVRVDYGFSKLRFSTRIFSQYAENNFRFRLSKDLPEQNQVHHRLKNNGLLQEILLPIKNNQWITGRIWYQHADRQIPPTSTQSVSEAAQQDKSLRASIEWNTVGRQFHWQLKSAWLNEINNYQDTLILLYAHNHFRTWLAEGETSFSLGEHINIATGIYTEASRGTSDNYPSGVTRDQSAVFSSARWMSDQWLCRMEVREELTNSEWSPLLIDFSTEWSAVKNVIFKAGISRNYRTPTLNDLNWRPGGNPDLLPEQGWTVEAGVHYKVSNPKFHFSTSLTGYARSIDEWIMWMPPVKDLREYWSPINISKVNSRGFESRGALSWSAGKWGFSINEGLDLTWSSFADPVPAFKIESGEQLFYIPVVNGMGGLELKLNRWTGYYTHHWFSSSHGINDEIKASNLGAAGLSIEFQKSKVKEALFIQVENIWNVPYRLIDRRPMPGRTFMVGVKFSV